MWIREYRGSKDMDAEFENGFIAKNKKYIDFKNGKIKNLYHPSTYDVGYIGKCEYRLNIIQYNIWHHMLARCYNKEFHKQFPTYKSCTVCEEWHSFQNFVEWYDENYYEIGNEKMQLDKDILFKGNKIYSPETCVFVPERINYLFIKHNSGRGRYPIGVCFNKDKNKFQSQINKYGDHINLGRFNTPEEAFQKYKTEKEKHIKEVADEYKDKIPQKLYNAMHKYEVEIDD